MDRTGVAGMSAVSKKPVRKRGMSRSLSITAGRRKSGWQQHQSKCAQFTNLSVWYLDDGQLAQLSEFADRTMTLQADDSGRRNLAF
ncbi:YaeQ protein [Salmonella bongori]|nr:YaeQ protein [Salmonella bongori]